MKLGHIFVYFVLCCLLYHYFIYIAKKKFIILTSPISNRRTKVTCLLKFKRNLEDPWVELVKKLNIFFWKTANQRFFKLQGSFISTSEIWANMIHNCSKTPKVAALFYILLTGCKLNLDKTFRRHLMYF